MENFKQVRRAKMEVHDVADLRNKSWQELIGWEEGCDCPLGGGICEAHKYVFDTLLWPTSMIPNGPPSMTKTGTLCVSKTLGGTDAEEKSERGVIRSNQTRI